MQSVPVWALGIPAAGSRVTDMIGLLPEEVKDSITQKLKAHEEATTQQFAVLIIESLEGDILEHYSMRVARGWRLGQKGKDNGVLLLVAYEDRKIRIEVGYGLEFRITDALAGRVIQNIMVPAFRDNEFALGIEMGVDRLIEIGSASLLRDIEEEPAVKYKSRRKQKSENQDGFWGAVFDAIIWFIEFLIDGQPKDAEGRDDGVNFRLLALVVFSMVLFLWVISMIPAKWLRTSRRRGWSSDSDDDDDSWGSSSSWDSDDDDFSGGGGDFGGGGASGSW